MSIYRLPSDPLFPEWAGNATQKSSTETSEFVPSQWLNDDTMGGLFGPLDANSKNAMVLKHRVARLEFWREFLVTQFRMNPVLSNRDPIISVPILAKLLRRKNTIPLGLQDIIVRTSLMEPTQVRRIPTDFCALLPLHLRRRVYLRRALSSH